MARSKLLNFAKNVSYTVSSNIIGLLISAITVFIVPKLVGVEEYGYYQLYLFYISYVGVSYLGWCDGIYLRIGGKYYKDLDKPLYSTQFWLLGLFELVVYSVIFGISCLVSTDANRHFVVICTCVVAIAMCLRWFITFILQATARIKEYAIVTISERILFVVLVMGLMIAGYRDFYLIVIADVIAKFISMSIGVIYCRDLVFGNRLLPVKSVVGEIYKNMSAGIKLMLASLCSMLIIGVIRFCVQSHWDIATFGKVSLTLSLSNMVVTAINAIAVVIYPMLRRTGDDKLPTIYGVMRIMLMGLIFGGIIFYYPAQKLLGLWLPQYAESLRYAAILLPICAYESKMSMLINTYFKTLRLENTLMKCNMAALAVSVVCSVISVFVLDSVTMAIISILISLVFRGVLSEMILSRHIDINVRKDILLELAMTVSFIICNWFFGFAGMLVYAACYALYLLVKKNDLKQTLEFVKSMR